MGNSGCFSIYFGDVSWISEHAEAAVSATFSADASDPATVTWGSEGTEDGEEAGHDGSAGAAGTSTDKPVYGDEDLAGREGRHSGTESPAVDPISNPATTYTSDDSSQQTTGTTGTSAGETTYSSSCNPGWYCSGSSGNSKVYTAANCERTESEYCPGGCSGGACLQSCKSCSADYAGQCGSFSDGCSGTLQCTCGSGKACVSGKCCAPVACAKGECGSKKNECWQSAECGSCEAGFYCNSYNKCVQKRTPDITGIKVFASATYAIVTWHTETEADSLAQYGETQQFGLQEFDGIKTTEHHVLLHGLKPETAYFFKAISAADGVTKESEILSFKTTQLKDEPLQVLAILVNPESKEQPEGQAFSFTAITNALNPGELEFYWDFGDDSNARGERVFHSFYGLGLEKEKEFSVKVAVKDVNGQAAGAEVKVKVLKAVFKAIVLEPAQYERHSKEKDLNVLIEFFDSRDLPIACDKVGLKALLAGTSLEMQCIDSNFFIGVFRPWPSLSELELLEISADYGAGGEKHYFRTRVPVYFEPSLVDATEAFKGKKYFFGDSLGDAKVRFLLNEIFLVFPTEIRASLVSGEKEEEVKIERQEYDYMIYFDHAVDESDLVQGLSLKLKGRDSIGNRVEEVQEVPIAKKNPALVISVLEPLEGERTYAFSQVVSLKAKILSDNYKVQGKKLLLECAGLDLLEELEFDMAKQLYSAEILLPDASEGKGSVECRLTAYGTLEGKELLDFEFVKIALSDKLKIEFIQPKAGLNNVWGGEIREFKARFFQPNNHLFELLGLDGRLSVDGNAQSVFLAFDEKEKLHKVLLDAPITAGGHSIALVLSGDFNGESNVVASIEQGIPWLSAISLETAAIAALLFLVLLFVFLFLRNSFRERRFLLQEKERLLGLEKKYKFEFFKRHIAESELNEKTRRLNTGLKRIESLLKEKFWAKAGLLKVFSRAKDLKKERESVQVASLVVRLAGRIGEFSREEIANGIKSEGYSAKVLEMVLKKLYGEK
ncbi:MAG: hypothetical protein NT067_01575 [Candidatus Diapherotrites archaeon]|nr:hypothetical protein [Candidatus Diapherotrites archaeon]